MLDTFKIILIFTCLYFKLKKKKTNAALLREINTMSSTLVLGE